jgi:membrane protein DedA with SNARE-associated domain
MTIDHILEFIRSQNEFIIYAILLISAYIENIFPPYPGDAITLSGAYLAGEGNISYIGVLISVLAGGIAGAMTLYFFGRIKGRPFFETGRGKYLIKGNLGRIDVLFARYGNVIILFSRFLAGIRSAVAVAAGISEVDVKRMAVLSTASIFIWNALLIGLMIYTKSNWRKIVELIQHFNIVLISLGILILAIWIFRALWRKRK